MSNVYGNCPVCGAAGVTRERRPNGNDKCASGHVYPSAQSVTFCRDLDEKSIIDKCRYMAQVAKQQVMRSTLTNIADLADGMQDKIARLEADVSRLQSIELRWRQEFHQRAIEWRGLESPCAGRNGCGGSGYKVYGSTATWRGGIGGQAITSDVCDKCWGSGDDKHPWPNHRIMENQQQTIKKFIDVQLKSDDTVASLEAECAALKADAVRYRLWRSMTGSLEPFFRLTNVKYSRYKMLLGDELDAAIDAAMQAGENP